MDIDNPTCVNHLDSQYLENYFVVEHPDQINIKSVALDDMNEIR